MFDLGFVEKACIEIESCLSFLELDRIKSHYLGKKGRLTNALRMIKDLSFEEKRKNGIIVNEVRDIILKHLYRKKNDLKNKQYGNANENSEIILKSQGHSGMFKMGKPHILMQVSNEVLEHLYSMGFEPLYGPEVEYEYYNFDLLNMSELHPARQMQDTIYVMPGVLLRTQTSPMQVRAMFSTKNYPIRICCSGKVYRHDQDSTHSPMFHQIEMLYVDEGVSLSDLKGVLYSLIEKIFCQANARFRCSFFPFTEPSIEVDIECFNCRGNGCLLCKMTGWIEVLGSGLVHPLVLKWAGIDTRYSGFAIGLGLERIAMLKYLISDIRHFYVNDLRFLSQF